MYPKVTDLFILRKVKCPILPAHAFFLKVTDHFAKSGQTWPKVTDSYFGKVTDPKTKAGPILKTKSTFFEYLQDFILNIYTYIYNIYYNIISILRILHLPYVPY